MKVDDLELGFVQVGKVAKTANDVGYPMGARADDPIGLTDHFDFLDKQKGVFAFLALEKQIVERLRSDHGIYLVGRGTLSLGALRDGDATRVAEAIAQQLS